jgi:Lamin Tail Domain
MRALRLFALLMLLGSMSLAFTIAQGQGVAPTCAPQPRQYDSLHIAWIDCLSKDEVVIIVNGEASDVDLTNYKLSSSGGETFAFPDNTIIKAHDILRIHSGPGNNQTFTDPQHDLSWLNGGGKPRTEEVWNNDGDTAILADASTPQVHVLDFYRYPAKP